MEKYKKKDMLEAVNLLLHVNDSVVKNAKANEKEDIIEALAQCQDVALALGNYLESLGEIGEGFVHILEDYCENLYQMSLIFSDENLCRKISKKIKKQLSSLKTSISLEIPSDKIEMVFLPYKVSMWDSLESVWRAASEDPECEAYVMPIPYFERNSKGELTIEHYEGNQFPKDVTIVNYLDYDLMEHKPDVVFIHNPYDQRNYVTSIHPSYYIPELKKCGCKVVYIPYYISAEANPDALEVQNGREGYVITPGVLYSDMVFVQSENVKRLFINILERKVSDVKRDYWEKRIFGLGSPKLDRIHSTERNDNKLPDKWHDLIYDSEGKRKKVIFYNVSISDLLNQEKMLDKIEDTLEFFSDKKDCVLWWRPHPLYEATLSSMRPGLFERYIEIVDRYKKEAWGIFDEGVDLEWAIAETDLYYGDSSSVVQLFKEAQKPVMIQNAFVKANQKVNAEDIPIWPSAFYVDGDDIWFVHGKMNVLMRYNISEDYVYIIDRIPNELLFQSSGYIGVYKYNHKIFMVPSQAREVAVYDIKNEQFRKIKVNDIEDYDGKGLFIKIYAAGKNLYCMPFWYKAVVKIDMEQEETESFIINSISNTYVNAATRINDEIIGIYTYTNNILSFNIKSHLVKIRSIGNNNHQFTNITSVGIELYLYDTIEKSIVKIYGKDYMSEKILYKMPYREVVLSSMHSELLIVDPVEDTEILGITLEGKVVFKIEGINDAKSRGLFSDYCHGNKGNNLETDEVIFYFSRGTYKMYQFIYSKIEKEFFMKLRRKEFVKLKNITLSIDQMEYGESDIYRLEDWKEKVSGNSKEKKLNCGQKILQEVKISI